jgi:hypothetical protein
MKVFDSAGVKDLLIILQLLLSFLTKIYYQSYLTVLHYRT